jgi:LPXTG-motif cell wall-anchored protein
VTDARPLPSSVSPSPGPGAAPVGWPPPGPGAAPVGWRPARPAGAPGLDGTREDLRSALLTVLALAVSGLAAGGLWSWLAPRADYRVTATDVEPIGKAPSAELFMADDGIFVLILAGLGLLAGIVVWLRRRRRGALTLVALATGLLAAGVVAWQLGEWAGPSPTTAQLHDVGARVTTGLSLGATAALAVGPFVAVLTYLVATAVTSRDDLGRGGPAPAEPLRPPLPPVPPPAARG